MNRAIRPIVVALLAIAGVIAITCYRYSARARADDQLISAVSRSDAGGVRSALARGADPNARVRVRDSADSLVSRVRSFFGVGRRPWQTPAALHVAASRGDSRAVALLLAHGADPNLPYAGDTSPLMMASANGDVASIRMLAAAGANVNAKNKFGDTALISACASEQGDVAAVLLELHADFNTRDELGFSPAIIASDVGATAIVRRLVSAGADVAATNRSGKSALRYAQEKHHDDIVRILKAAGKAR